MGKRPSRYIDVEEASRILSSAVPGHTVSVRRVRTMIEQKNKGGVGLHARKIGQGKGMWLVLRTDVLARVEMMRAKAAARAADELAAQAAEREGGGHTVTAGEVHTPTASAAGGNGEDPTWQTTTSGPGSSRTTPPGRSTGNGSSDSSRADKAASEPAEVDLMGEWLRRKSQQPTQS